MKPPSPIANAMMQRIQNDAASKAGYKKIRFVMQEQEQTNWCWAATSASVSVYFDTNSTWTQCSIATAGLLVDCCNGNGALASCNKTWELDKALAIVSCLNQMVAKPQTFEKVHGEIESGRPVGVRVAWDKERGHFLAVVGWVKRKNGAREYIVDDPIWGRSRIGNRELEKEYHGGQWSHTYFTRAPKVVAPANNQVFHDPSAVGA